MDDTSKPSEIKAVRTQTAQQKLNNFLRSSLAKEYPLCPIRRLVLHALASYCYYKDECNPSLKSLLDYTQYKDDDYLSQVLRDIQALGLISITTKNGAKNSYTLKIPTVDDAEIYHKKTVRKSTGNTKPPGNFPGGNHPDCMGVVSTNHPEIFRDELDLM